MLSEELEKEGYRIVGNHSAIKICEWTKKSLRDEDFCYKEKFYRIQSHRCVQMSCSLFNCQNKCIHCWRNLNYTDSSEVKNPNLPNEIIDKCVFEHKKILQGFKGSKKTNIKKFLEAMQPKHFAISLTGEATLYPRLPELIKELRKRRISSFLVTNGLLPEKLKELQKQDALPTQLYISLNSANKENYEKWHQSSCKGGWQRFNKSLEILKELKGKTRTVVRITLVKDLNMKNEMIKNYAKLIKKASPTFIEIKSYMAVGYARKRLGYEKMPTHQEIIEFAKKLLKFLPKYKFLDEKFESKVILLGQNREKMKIKKSEI